MTPTAASESPRIRAKRPFFLRFVACAVAAIGMAACADPSPTYYQAFGFQCASKHGKVSDAMCNKSHDPGNARSSRYCYKTLADTNCFDRPDPDAKNMPQGSPG
jgi:hypothetical protein